MTTTEGGPMDAAQRQILPDVTGPVRPGRVRPSGRRRRPSGEAPPLPHHLQTSGVGWLVASVVLVVLSMLVFAGGLGGLAVVVTVADDAVVRWRAGPHRAGGRGPDRCAGRCSHRGHGPAGLVPPVRPQRGVPDQIPPWPGR